MNNIKSNEVSLIETEASYPAISPYHPSEAYEDYIFHDIPCALSSEKNVVYSGVRNLLHLLGLNVTRWGASDWNPFGDIVSKDQTILIKPNWVYHKFYDPAKEASEITNSEITHTAIMRPIIDYAYKAVGENGRIIIADAPIQNTDFKILLKRSGILEIVNFYKKYLNFNIEIMDLRLDETVMSSSGRILERKKNTGDLLGYAKVNIGSKSALVPLDAKSEKYRALNYDESDIVESHSKGRHEYLISNSVLNADLVINVPKLKTHLKTGITAALKNLVGINGNKAYLPHYCVGSAKEDGDEYPVQNVILRLKGKYSYKFSTFPAIIREPIRKIYKGLIFLSRRFKSHNDVGGADPYLISGGNWYGNDTSWRMVIDLNNILKYSDTEGQIKDSPQRKVLSIVDAIVCGEGNGPLSPDPKPLGCMIGGFNPMAIDVVCSRLMGFDWNKIPLLREGSKYFGVKNDLRSVKIHTSNNKCLGLEQIKKPTFIAPSGWQGHIEL